MRSHLGLATCIAALCLFTPGPARAQERPNLTNTRVSSPFGANGHSSTVDGRIFIGNVYEDATTMTTRWQVRVFRKEALRYGADGRVDLSAAFSPGKILEVHNGENALAFCFTNPDAPYRIESGQAVYEPWVFDSQMFGSGPQFYQMRRRQMSIRVSNPFTTSAEIASVTAGPVEILRTTSGGVILGIEPTMTADGRLFLYQGGPSNNGVIDHLMYSYNDAPCGASGWTPPKPLSAMYGEAHGATPALLSYPLSWAPMLAATGEAFDASRELIHAAYPWVDHEGRNVFYMAVPFPAPVGGRREAVSVIGAETAWTAYHIDGGINAERSTVAKLFYSGPMWAFEQERPPGLTLPSGQSNEDQYLPVSHNHDVFPLFGSNTADYNEVDLADLSDPFHLLYLPMNELVTRAGEYDLSRSPDLSGHFFTAALTGDAKISETNAVTTSSSLWEPHSRGKALVLGGAGSAQVRLRASTTQPLPQAVDGLTVQLALKPDAGLDVGCSNDATRYLLKQRGVAEVLYHSDGGVELALWIGGRRVSFGRTSPLPRGAWSHVAWAWDGAAGRVVEYVNGIPTGRTLPVASGRVSLKPGTLIVGAGDAPGTGSCPTGGGFIGALDEVRIFTHARSARSVCLSTLGSDCLEDAVDDDPTAGQFDLTAQHPGCTGPDALDTTACASAIHRVCAQRGAMDALASTSNAADTLAQLISSRPPISLAGVPVTATSSSAQIACAPIEHQSVALSFLDLMDFHDGCADDRAATSTACGAATHRFCNSLGWTSGLIFEVTSRPWVSCFDADLVADVPRSALGGCAGVDWSEPTCRLAVSAWCQQQGLDGGLIQEIPATDVANVACFEAATVQAWGW